MEEGYGLSMAALERVLAEAKPQLFVALDCGTNSKPEVDRLRAEGVDVIVVDHHVAKESRVTCTLVNPRVNDAADAPWQSLCTAGLVFKLVHGILKVLRLAGDERGTSIVVKDYLDLAALGTIADLVPLRSENRILAAHGLKALGEASTTPSGGAALKHYIAAGTAGQFKLDDLNKLMTRTKRINESWAGGTPADPYSTGLTDLYVSPEIKEKIRAFAYNPLNTVGGVRTEGSGSGTITKTATESAIALPDGMREEIYRNAGMQEIYGVNIIELIELGLDKKYNVLFDSYISETATLGAAFTPGNFQILVGVDNTKGALIRAVATSSETGSQFNVQPDDQFLQRSDKAGFYGSMEEGRVCIDARALSGIIV
jgi:hypothetical protein